MRKAILALATFALLAFAALIGRGRVRAEGVVTDCTTDFEFTTKLSGGGTVTFDCGDATILFPGGGKTITVDTTIDGQNHITLSAVNLDRLFYVTSGATLTLKNIVLEDGHAFGDGGAIYNQSYLVLDHVTIRDSHTDASHSGGAIATYGPLEMTDSVLDHNGAGNGGAIFAIQDHADVTIMGGYVTHNTATSTTDGWGGAVLLWDGATLHVTGADIADNSARYGGAIHNAFLASTIDISRTSFVHNYASLSGGAIYQNGSVGGFAGDDLVTESTLEGNNAGVSGGGAEVGENGSLRFDRVTASDNGAPYGGAVSNEGSFESYTSTISGNHGTSDGAGLYNAGVSTLYDVTLANNSGSGAVVSDALPNAALFLIGVLIDTPPGLANCSFTQAPEITMSLSSDNSCSFGSGRDGIDPNLGPLTDNGGPTWTHMLMAGSPAIDLAADVCEQIDQRGAPRPFGAACDVGAVEFGSSPYTPTPSPSPTHSPSPTPSPTPSATPTAGPHHKQGDLDCGGTVNARDALRPVRAQAGVPMTQPGGCPSLDFGQPDFADVTCDGAIGGGDAVAILEFSAGVAIKPTPHPGCVPIGQNLP